MAKSTKLYTSQDALRVQLRAGMDLSTCSTVLIRYKDPDGNFGSWTGTLNYTGSIATACGAVYYDLQNPLRVRGRWHFWIKATFSDTRVAPSITVSEFVYAEGE